MIWIFGYGSLVWRPAFEHAERQPARVEGFVGLEQVEDAYVGAHGDLRGELEEVHPVLSGEVGHRAQDPLAPQQVVLRAHAHRRLDHRELVADVELVAAAEHRAARRLVEAAEDVDRRRLPRAVRPQQPR